VEAVIHLDTHVVAWLFAGDLERLGEGNRTLLVGRSLVISPMVELELEYLYEIGHTTIPGAEVVEDLERRLGLSRSDRPFPEVVAVALAQTWTRDPFDRLIVAQAAIDSTPLLTKDATIRDHYPEAVWEG